MYTPGPHGVSSNCSYINLSAPTLTLVRSTDDQDTPGPHGVSSNCSYINLSAIADDQDTPGPHGVSSNCSYINLSAIDRRSRYTGSARCIPILARVVVVVVVVRNHRRRRRRRCRRGRSRSADIRPSNRSCNPDCFIHVVVYRCTGVPMCWCTGIPGYWCTCVPVYRCTGMLLYRCTNVLGYHWGFLGAPWGLWGPSWSPPGANLTPYRGQLGTISGPCRAILWPCWAFRDNVVFCATSSIQKYRRSVSLDDVDCFDTFLRPRNRTLTSDTNS